MPTKNPSYYYNNYLTILGVCVCVCACACVCVSEIFELKSKSSLKSLCAQLESQVSSASPHLWCVCVCACIFNLKKKKRSEARMESKNSNP